MARLAFVARLTPDGALDGTFGTNGVASVPDAGGGAVAIDAQGRVLSAGGSAGSHFFRSHVNPNGGFLVARFTTRGRLDEATQMPGCCEPGWVRVRGTSR